MTDNFNSPLGFIISVKDLWNLVRINWLWFVLSVAACLFVAAAYIATTPPTYTRSANVMIKDNAKGKSTMSAGGGEAFNEMGLLKANTDINSELYILRSPVLMETVVKRLKLEYNYRAVHRHLRMIDLYEITPFTVELDSVLVNSPISFTARLQQGDKVSVSDFTINGIPSDFTAEGTLAEPIVSPYGSFTLYATAYHTPNSPRTIYFSKDPVYAVVRGTLARLRAELVKDDAPIITLSYADYSARRAEDVLNMLITVYNENWIKDKNQIATSTSHFIDERLKVIESELGSVDASISSYKSANLLPDVAAVSSIYLAQSTTNASNLAALQTELSLAQNIRTHLRAAAGKNQLLPANSGIANPNIEAQIDKYNALMIQKNSLVQNSSEQNPVVADMIQTLGSMKDIILRSVDDYISTLNIQSENIRREEGQIQRKIASNPEQAKHLLSEERQQKVKESLFLFLLQKREENELTQAFSAYNTKVVNAPSGPLAPTSPRRNVVMMAALVIGLMIPLLVILMIESLNTLVRDRSDLEKLALPFVGEVPYLYQGRKGNLLKRIFYGRDDKKDDSVKVVVENKSRNMINEAFRSIRTNIDFMRPKGDKGTVMVVTSMHVDSGKTFISVNVAMSMAVKGARTVMLDMDLRKASLSELASSPKQGLAAYLNGSVTDLDQVIVKGGLDPNLDILPVGKIPPNPTELLLGERLPELLETLSAKYDYVFMDCPPMDIIADTSIIAKYADMTLFVVRAGLMDKRMLPDIEAYQTEGKLKGMAVILNGLDYSPNRYGYRRYGYYHSRYGYGSYGYNKKGYGYGYGYGYGSNDQVYGSKKGKK